MFVHDFVHIDRPFDAVRSSACAGGGVLLQRLASTARAPRTADADAMPVVWATVGEPRDGRSSTFVPIMWWVAEGVVTEVDVDLELAAIGTDRTRASLSGSVARRAGPTRWDDMVATAAVEALLRSFLRGLEAAVATSVDGRP